MKDIGLDYLNSRINSYVCFDDLLCLIYDSEINIEISSLWDGGWSYRIGDCLNGFTSDNHCNSVGSGTGYASPVDMYQDIVNSILELYPESKFKKDLVNLKKLMS